MSFDPPPCEELTTSDPSRSATRDRPPGSTQVLRPVTANGLRSTWRGRMPESDADQLARVTHVPALFWVGVFLLVNVAALVVGAFLLAGQWLPDMTA